MEPLDSPLEIDVSDEEPDNHLVHARVSLHPLRRRMPLALDSLEPDLDMDDCDHGDAEEHVPAGDAGDEVEESLRAHPEKPTVPLVDPRAAASVGRTPGQNPTASPSRVRSLCKSTEID